MTEPDGTRALRELVSLLQIEKRLQTASDLDELAFLLVNDARQAIGFDQATLLCGFSGGRLAVRAVTGVSRPARDAPRLQSLERLVCSALEHLAGPEPVVLAAERFDAALAADWNSLAVRNALWVPLLDRSGSLFAGLWLSREQGSWRAAEIAQLSFLGHAAAHAWCALQDAAHPGARWAALLRVLLSRRRAILAACAVAVLALLFPVRQSALAPAEIAAREPWILSPPVDGVIATVEVQPNQSVKAGEILFTLDERLLRNRHDVALQALEVARADHARAVQKSFVDPAAKGEVNVLAAVVEQKSAEVVYTADLLERIRIRAPADGIVLFSDPHDWLGRPVGVGEKVMTLANAEEAELQIWLSVDEAVNLESGAEIQAFLNVDPTRTLRATLRSASYTAEPGRDDVLAYRVRADLQDVPPPRIGLQGTAKIYGPRVTLFYQVFRRPLGQLRRWAGL